MSTLRLIVCLTVFAIAAGKTAAGENTYYRWTDERGNTMHSDRPPPPGTEYEVVSTGSTFMRQVGPDEGAVPLDVDPTVGNEFEQVEKENLKPPKVTKNPELCERATRNMEALTTAPRIRIKDDSTGDHRFLSPDEIEAKKLQAQQVMDAHCE